MYYKVVELYPKEKFGVSRYSSTYLHMNEGDIFWFFLDALTINGQILKGYKIIKKNKAYLIYVTTPKNDSLSEKYDSALVKACRKDISKEFNLAVKECGSILDSRGYCNCKERHRMIMHAVGDQVFLCCDCVRPIALYELPQLKSEKGGNPIQQWKNNYLAMEALWENNLYDCYARNQLANFDSALNKQGLEIAQQMSEQIGYPVYYYLKDDCKKVIKKAGGRDVCPKCGKKKKSIFVDLDPMRRIGWTQDFCTECNLAFPRA